ncbi:MAG: HDOD domain-containing protein [Pseudomonadota bacterium]
MAITKWLARMFGGSSADDTLDAPCAAPAPVAPVPVDAAPPNVDGLFYRWLTGSASREAAPGIDKLILDELARLAASPDAGAALVPRVPAVIPQLLRSLRDDSVSGADLSRQLAQDVVLVAEVIREANSPYYHPTAPVRNIEGAVMLLGQNGLRMVVARVSFRPIISMQAGQFARHVAPLIWSQSEKCALGANLLAAGLRANPFEAYLASLMQNVGLIVAFRLIDQIYAGADLPQSEHFIASLFAEARAMSARIATLWDFPDTVAAAIAKAGQPDAAPLARALALADRLAKLRLLVDAGQLDADAPGVLHGLDKATLACFEKLRSEED